MTRVILVNQIYYLLNSMKIVNTRKSMLNKKITQTKLIIVTSIFLVIFDNYIFFKNTIKIYPLNVENIGFLISLVLVLTALIIFIFTLVSSKYTTKGILIFTLLVSSLTNYFMNSYGIFIDVEMIRNIIQTDLNESLDLITLKQVLYLLFLGIIPSIFVFNAKIEYRNMRVEVISKAKTIALSLVIISASIFLFSKSYTSFAREHKHLRFSTNPTFWIYSTVEYLVNTINPKSNKIKPLGLDASIKDGRKRKIVIMIVGEAVRADHLALNGYKRDTTPLLKKENIINFSNFYSCGTSTAVSVPCMFSYLTKDEYTYKKGLSQENVLDVLKHTNRVSILWRENNSNSKGVALRVENVYYKNYVNNKVCDSVECRDEGMLIGLDEYIKSHSDKDILIVLHQMGNHGPAYYKRYPKEFEKFTPTCKTNQLEQCSKQEISNAYDNAIVYTDYFLSKTINLLKKYKNASTAMVYISDHGESLGENGVYLHGLPYFIAPQAQINVASLMWFNTNTKYINNTKRYSQDNLFHTLLGLFDVKTEVYKRSMDILP